MSRGMNRVTLLGTLGKDPEVRYSQAGAAMATLSLATSESWKDKVTGEKQERTEWHRVKLFGRQAELAGEYLAKGNMVGIEGSLRTEKYTGKDGVEKYSTDVICQELHLLGGGGGGDRDSQAPARGASSNGGGRPAAGGRQGSERQTGERAPGPGTYGGSSGNPTDRSVPYGQAADGTPLDDEIPF